MPNRLPDLIDMEKKKSPSHPSPPACPFFPAMASDKDDTKTDEEDDGSMLLSPSATSSQPISIPNLSSRPRALTQDSGYDGTPRATTGDCDDEVVVVVVSDADSHRQHPDGDDGDHTGAASSSSPLACITCGAPPSFGPNPAAAAASCQSTATQTSPNPDRTAFDYATPGETPVVMRGSRMRPEPRRLRYYSVGNESRVDQVQQVQVRAPPCPRGLPDLVNPMGERHLEPAAFRGRAYSEPARPVSAVEVGRELRRISDEFELSMGYRQEIRRGSAYGVQFQLIFVQLWGSISDGVSRARRRWSAPPEMDRLDEGPEQS